MITLRRAIKRKGCCRGQSDRQLKWNHQIMTRHLADVRRGTQAVTNLLFKCKGGNSRSRPHTLWRTYCMRCRYRVVGPTRSRLETTSRPSPRRETIRCRANFAPNQFSAFTRNHEILSEPSYPLCNVPGNHPVSTPHIHDDSAPTTLSRTVLHSNATLAPASLASPDAPSSSVPAPRHVDKILTDVPPLDDNISIPVSTQSTYDTAIESRRISAVLDPGTTRAIATHGGIDTTASTMTLTSRKLRHPPHLLRQWPRPPHLVPLSLGTSKTLRMFHCHPPSLPLWFSTIGSLQVRSRL
jgi:hypothetical protein